MKITAEDFIAQLEEWPAFYPAFLEANGNLDATVEKRLRQRKEDVGGCLHFLRQFYCPVYDPWRLRPTFVNCFCEFLYLAERPVEFWNTYLEALRNMYIENQMDYDIVMKLTKSYNKKRASVS
jgi:hypothetical protein